jgi:hypothetical protein
MRPFTPYDRTKQSSQAGKKKERKTRLSTEWDIRIDCDQEYADRIVDSLKNSTGPASYLLVSGIEQPDNADITWGSKELHVHIALVSEYPLRRDQALSLIRGNVATTEEYAVPRNTKYTYAGWYLHHTKLDWKLVNEPAIRFEYGTLPEDATDIDTKGKVQRMFKKFGCGDDQHQALHRIKFIEWLD